MSRDAPRRTMVLAGVALLAGVLAVAFAGRGAGHGRPGPASAPAPGGGWYRALVAVDESERAGVVTVCGRTLSAATAGIVHPLLPCGTRLVLAYGGREQPARVVDRTPSLPGRDFAVTPALARRLRLAATGLVGWRFAVPPPTESR
jgi:hypothetical protein